MSFLARQKSKLIDGFNDFADAWIGCTFPPVERAIEETNWLPDDRNAYCPRCGDSVGQGEVTPEGCGTCRPGCELAGGIGDGIVRLGIYVEPLQRWVADIKYRKWIEMGSHLGQLLGKRINEAEVIDLSKAVVIPTPMSWQRRMYRGVDHTQTIAASVAQELGVPMARVMARDNRLPQTSLNRASRKRGGSHGFRIRKRLGGWPLHDAHIILIDDVRTTGATLRAATRLLRKGLHPERIVCGVLAVSDSKARTVRKQAELSVRGMLESNDAQTSALQL